MEIFNNNYRPIKCIRNDEDGLMVASENHHLLKIGEIYHVVDVDVHDWYTVVYLEEFPGVEFNSVVFEEV